MFLAAGISAYADSVTLNFDSLSENSTNKSIAAYINSALAAAGCAGCTVTVNGITATGSGSSLGTVYADQTYTGEGNVVGPGGKSVTLGNTNGATGNNAPINTNANGSTKYDTFLSNVSDGSTSGGSQIDLHFSGLTLGTVSFDYEIFPDGTCPELNHSNCGYNRSTGVYADLPDFELKAGTSIASDSLVSGFGTGGVQYGVIPGSGDGNSTGSPEDSTETAPQWIGVSGPLNLSGDTDVDFIDWPAAIGIDNLTICFGTNGCSTGGGDSPVPETSSVLLLGTVSALLIPLLRRFRKA